jgi:hypothetical protein
MQAIGEFYEVHAPFDRILSLIAQRDGQFQEAEGTVTSALPDEGQAAVARVDAQRRKGLEAFHVKHGAVIERQLGQLEDHAEATSAEADRALAHFQSQIDLFTTKTKGPWRRRLANSDLSVELEGFVDRVRAVRLATQQAAQPIRTAIRWVPERPVFSGLLGSRD